MAELDQREVERPVVFRRGADEGEIHRILLRQPEVRLPVHHAENRLAGGPLQIAVRIGQQRRVAPELVDRETREQFAFGGRQRRIGAEKRGVHAAPVDVPGQQHLGPGVGGHVHIHDVVGLEVHLAGAARAFEHDRVVFGGEAVVAAFDGLPQPGLVRVIFAHFHVADRAPFHDHLAAEVAFWLEQDRIHPHVGIEAARFGLYRLRPADLAAVGRHIGVERHILRLERGDAPAVLQQNPAERGGQDALARVGAGPLQHQGGRAAAGQREGFRGERVEQPVLLLFRPDRDAHILRPQPRIVRAAAHRDPVFAKQPLRKAGTIGFEQQEIRVRQMDRNSGKRGEFSGEPFAQFRGFAAGVFAPFRRQSEQELRHLDRGRRGAPDSLPGAELRDQRRGAGQESHPQPRQCVKFGQRTADQQIRQPHRRERFRFGDEVDERLVDQEQRLRIRLDHRQESGARREPPGRIVGIAEHYQVARPHRRRQLCRIKPEAVGTGEPQLLGRDVRLFAGARIFEIARRHDQRPRRRERLRRKSEQFVRAVSGDHLGGGAVELRGDQPHQALRVRFGIAVQQVEAAEVALERSRRRPRRIQVHAEIGEFGRGAVRPAGEFGEVAAVLNIRIHNGLPPWLYPAQSESSPHAAQSKLLQSPSRPPPDRCRAKPGCPAAACG